MVERLKKIFSICWEAIPVLLIIGMLLLGIVMTFEAILIQEGKTRHNISER